MMLTDHLRCRTLRKEGQTWSLERVGARRVGTLADSWGERSWLVLAIGEGVVELFGLFEPALVVGTFAFGLSFFIPVVDLLYVYGVSAIAQSCLNTLTRTKHCWGLSPDYDRT